MELARDCTRELALELTREFTRDGLVSVPPSDGDTPPDADPPPDIDPRPSSVSNTCRGKDTMVPSLSVIDRRP